MAGGATTEWRDRPEMHSELIAEPSEVVSGWF
jgi:hypothetical protein